MPFVVGAILTRNCTIHSSVYIPGPREHVKSLTLDVMVVDHLTDKYHAGAFDYEKLVQCCPAISSMPELLGVLVSDRATILDSFSGRGISFETNVAAGTKSLSCKLKIEVGAGVTGIRPYARTLMETAARERASEKRNNAA